MSDPPSLPRPTLVTGRLVLRPFRREDGPALCRLLRDRRIAANTRSIPFPYSLELAEAWIDQHDELWQSGRSVIFAISRHAPAAPSAGAEPCDAAELIGAIGLEINAEDENAELGYWIGSACWNQGYATEAVRAIVSMAFRELGLHRIWAMHMTRNPASGRVLRAAGFECEGHLRQHVKKWGVFEDVCIYGICRSDGGHTGG